MTNHVNCHKSSGQLQLAFLCMPLQCMSFFKFMWHYSTFNYIYIYIYVHTIYSYYIYIYIYIYICVCIYIYIFIYIQYFILYYTFLKLRDERFLWIRFSMPNTKMLLSKQYFADCRSSILIPVFIQSTHIELLLSIFELFLSPVA